MKFSHSVYLIIPFLVSCGTKAPDCSDQATKDIVLKRVQNDVKTFTSNGLFIASLQSVAQHVSNLTSKSLELSEEFDKVEYSLDKIRETNFDNKDDIHNCAATLTSSFKGSKESIEIAYSSQLEVEEKKPNVLIEGISNENYGALLSVLFQEISNKKISEIKRLRSEIGDSNVPNFIEKNCSGFDKNEKLCNLGKDIASSIKQEESQFKSERSDFFRKNPKSLREVYNKCGDEYYKAAGLVRDGRNLYGAEIIKIDNVRFEMAKVDKKFFDECKIAEEEAINLDVENATYFKPENKVDEVKSNSSMGLEEHEEVDRSQDPIPNN